MNTLITAPMLGNGCQHDNVGTDTAVHRIVNSENPAQPYFTMAVRVHCTDCGARFRFLGDNPRMPHDCGDAMARKLGAWVDDVGTELGALIAPVDTSDPLAQIAVQGRA